MSTSVTTTRPIDLALLAIEVGTDKLAMSVTGTEATVTVLDDSVTHEQLQDAVNTHIPPPAPSTPREIQGQIDELTDLLLDNEVI